LSDEFDREYPLVEATVSVEDDPRGPGRYRVFAYLLTHAMTSAGIGVAIRLVLDLTPPARRR
jgi:predicted component of type VI protein secretion system